MYTCSACQQEEKIHVLFSPLSMLLGVSSLHVASHMIAHTDPSYQEGTKKNDMIRCLRSQSWYCGPQATAMPLPPSDASHAPPTTDYFSGLPLLLHIFSEVLVVFFLPLPLLPCCFCLTTLSTWHSDKLVISWRCQTSKRVHACLFWVLLLSLSHCFYSSFLLCFFCLSVAVSCYIQVFLGKQACASDHPHNLS